MTIHLPPIVIAHAHWLTSNGRYYWADKARRTKQIRTHTAWSMLAAQAPPVTDYPVLITARIGYPKNGPADPENAHPSVKACIDRLRDAGVLAEDNDRHVAGVYITRDTEKAPPGTHTIRIDLTPSKEAA